MLRFAAGVDVSAFHALRHGEPSLQQAPQAAVNGAEHGNAVHDCRHFALFHKPTYLHFRLKYALRRRTKHPLGAVAADDAGNACIGNRRAAVQHPAQSMPSHGLHGGVAIFPGREARADTDDHRGIVKGSAQIALGQNGVHHRRRPQRRQHCALRIRQHGNYAGGGKSQRILRRSSPNSLHILYPHPTQTDSLRKANRAADGGGLRQIRHNDAISRTVQTQGDACCNVPRSANENCHFSLPAFLILREE